MVKSMGIFVNNEITLRDIKISESFSLILKRIWNKLKLFSTLLLKSGSVNNNFMKKEAKA